MERRRGNAVALSALDRVYLRRACELAARGRGSTSPNPCVGALLVDGASTLGEGYHRVRGGPHAEVEALRDAATRGADVRGSTMYVTLEPCDHTGLTPPCSRAVVAAGIARVVVGIPDPNPRTAGAGLATLRDAGIVVDVAYDAWSRDLVAAFSISVARTRPYLRLKLAASLDGYVASRRGRRHWLTGYDAREYVRELRATHDAVLVGAGTVRIDDPQLTVRPPFGRRKSYRRIVAAQRHAPRPESAVFAPGPDYERTIVFAPAGLRKRFASLEAVADVVYVGGAGARTLDLPAALETLPKLGVASVLCEGGPTLAAALLTGGLVDRFDWLVAPALLGSPAAVPVLAGSAGGTQVRFDRVEALGPDVLLSGVPGGGLSCSVA